MPRFILTGCAALVLLMAASPSRSDDGPKPVPALAEDSRIPKLISQLGDADPAVRNDAVERLINLRGAAWPVLRLKLETASPLVRSGIDRVLLHISWLQPDEDGAVVEAFKQYASLDAEARCERIVQFWMPGAEQPAPTSALLRILLNDPSTAVRWQAASMVVVAFTVADEKDPGAPVPEQKLKEITTLRQQVIDLVEGTRSDPNVYTAPLRNAPLIAVAGIASRRKPARCTQLIEMALTMEQDQPTEFRGQMDFVFTWLISRASMQRQYGRMIQLMRERADRTPCSVEPSYLDASVVPSAVTDLFAAQANYGPDAGFKDDLRVYREYLANPQMLYALSRVALRTGHLVWSKSASEGALVLGGFSVSDHYQTGFYLTRRHWNDAAERELKYCLKLPPDPNFSLAYVYMLLSEVAADRTDDLAAARYMETGLQKDTSRIQNVAQYWASVYDHYLRYAQQTNNLPAIRENLDKLLGDDQGRQTLKDDASMAADIVPALQLLGKKELADALFTEAAEALEKKVREEPEDPMLKNNLAWLFACCNKRLDEAVTLIARAIEEAPDEGASWDTQAEIFMRLGQPAKAVESEIKARELKPDDVYMVKQLERFKAAVAKQRN